MTKQDYTELKTNHWRTLLELVDYAIRESGVVCRPGSVHQTVAVAGFSELRELVSDALERCLDLDADPARRAAERELYAVVDETTEPSGTAALEIARAAILAARAAATQARVTNEAADAADRGAQDTDATARGAQVKTRFEYVSSFMEKTVKVVQCEHMPSMVGQVGTVVQVDVEDEDGLPFLVVLASGESYWCEDVEPAELEPTSYGDPDAPASDVAPPDGMTLDEVRERWPGAIQALPPTAEGLAIELSTADGDLLASRRRGAEDERRTSWLWKVTPTSSHWTTLE